MDNWAIVIGVNKYQKSEFNLRGAVNDALAMREWLLNNEGGQVPIDNLFTLLSDTDTSNFPRRTLEASTKSIIETIQNLVANSQGRGKRLFFYFSGHGLSRPGNFGGEDAIIPSDFLPSQPNFGTLSIKSITEYFAGLKFEEQFFFFDACRNVPFKENFRIGHYPGVPDEPQPTILQFTYYATSPGLEAAEVQQHAGFEGGAFTKALLDGLKGEGRAKIYEPISNQYQIKNERLIEFIGEEVKKTLSSGEEEFIRFPQIDGPHHKSPVLAHFPITKFNPVKLEVFIEPKEIGSQVEITIRGGLATVPKKGTILPIEFDLYPNDYGVGASSDNFLPKRTDYGVKLYSPQKVTVEMIESATDRSQTQTDHMSSSDAQGTIVVFSKDKCALLELYDIYGKFLGSGLGRLEKKLESGSYKARIVLSDDRKIEEIINLSRGKTILKELPPLEKSEPVENVDQNLERITIENKSIQISDDVVGDLIEPRLTTVLALASRATAFDPDIWQAVDLRELGVRGFQDTGVHILVGSESENIQDDIKFANSLRIRIWKQNEEIGKETQGILPLKLKGFGEFAKNLESGSYWISFETEDKQSMIFSLSILWEHTTLLVLQRNKDSSVRMFQYMPEARGYGSHNRNFEISNIRKLEIIQKYYTTDIFDYFFKDALDLAYEKWYDPMAGLVSGNLMLKNLGPDESHSLDTITRNMTERIPEISDSFVMKGRYNDAKGNHEEAQFAFKRAAELGVPIFTENLTSLHKAIISYQLPKTKYTKIIKLAFEQRTRGSLWTSFIPFDLRNGKLFEKN